MTETEQQQERRLPLLGITLGILALAVLVGLSTLIGFVGAPKKERFDWELAAVFGTALGTTLVAIATVPWHGQREQT